MARPAHTRVTFSGIIGESTAVIERWSFNVNFPASVLDDEASDATADALATGARGAYGYVNTQMPTDVIFTEARVAAVNGAGHVYQRADGSYVQGINNTPMPGGQAQQPMPLQTALCVSLRTGRAGPTGKGRFFLPWPALSLDADDKRIPVNQIEPMRDDVIDFLQHLATAMGEDPVVVSSYGYTTPVTSIALGRVPDTMRSRREDSPEGYVTALLHP